MEYASPRPMQAFTHGLCYPSNETYVSLRWDNHVVISHISSQLSKLQRGTTSGWVLQVFSAFWSTQRFWSSRFTGLKHCIWFSVSVNTTVNKGFYKKTKPFLSWSKEGYSEIWWRFSRVNKEKYLYEQILNYLCIPCLHNYTDRKSIIRLVCESFFEMQWNLELRT